MRKSFTLFLVILAGFCRSQQPVAGIGMWKEHLPYNSAIDVTASSSQVFCATPYSLFVVNKENREIERLSKMTGLSETGISCISFDEAHQKLFIGYSNSNIDIIEGNSIHNLPDIKRDNIIGDKNIYNIHISGNDYYLSTGLGIIVINSDRYEVKDTWFIGINGAQVKVNGVCTDASTIYAATDEGLKISPLTNVNHADYNNWQLISGSNGLSAGPCNNVYSIGGKIIVQKNDSLFVRNGNAWTLFYTDGWPFISSQSTEGKISICQRRNNEGRVVYLNSDASVNKIISQVAPVSLPRKAILLDNEPWIADQYGGLSWHHDGSYEVFKPNSPEATASGQLIVRNKVFYATAGGVNSAWNYGYNGNGIFRLENGNWTNINRFVYPQLDSLLDFIAIAIDPVDESAWAGSFGGGLLKILPGNQFEIFKQGYISPAIGDPQSYRVSGLAFDTKRNLWISNYGSSQPLAVRRNNGSWKSFTIPFFLNDNAVSQIIIDSEDRLWIVSPKNNGLILFDPGLSIENSNDDRWRMFSAGAGNGNLPSSEVNVVTIDKDGYLWVGTGDGIGVIQCTEEIFSAACQATWPVIAEGNFAGYLFKGQEVNDIAVDGANRKWVATKNGVYLINADGTKLLNHFTETNSPLLSNDVKKIAIDGYTGEVYFATFKGICSYRGTATEAAEGKREVLVFPNPVPPSYTGIIGIRGLIENSIVKITELDGRLVYQTRARGGQATWDGRDYKGRKISSGVYLVLVTDDEKKQTQSTKIVFIGR